MSLSIREGVSKYALNKFGDTPENREWLKRSSMGDILLLNKFMREDEA